MLVAENDKYVFVLVHGLMNEVEHVMGERMQEYLGMHEERVEEVFDVVVLYLLLEELLEERLGLGPGDVVEVLEVGGCCEEDVGEGAAGLVNGEQRLVETVGVFAVVSRIQCVEQSGPDLEVLRVVPHGVLHEEANLGRVQGHVLQIKRVRVHQKLVLLPST